MTIPPTSVESERSFSAVGLFVTKFRSRLDDKEFNNLCQLRGYYLKERAENVAGAFNGIKLPKK